MKKSLLPMNARLVGCDKPLTTVFTERLGSVIDGPDDGDSMLVWMLVELSLASGSDSAAVTLALFVRIPTDCGRTKMFMMAKLPLGSEPRLQVTVLLPVHEP